MPADLISGRAAEFLLYQGKDGRTRIEVRFDGDTAWLSLERMVELFQRDKSVISRHIANVSEDGEIDRQSAPAIVQAPLAQLIWHHQVSLKEKPRSLSTKATTSFLATGAA